MRITGIRVYAIDLPLAGAGYTFAKGKQVTSVDMTVVRIDTDAGLSGWGETCPLGRTHLAPGAPVAVYA